MVVSSVNNNNSSNIGSQHDIFLINNRFDEKEIKIFENIFNSLDIGGKGYICKDDFEIMKKSKENLSILNIDFEKFLIFNNSNITFYQFLSLLSLTGISLNIPVSTTQTETPSAYTGNSRLSFLPTSVIQQQQLQQQQLQQIQQQQLQLQQQQQQYQQQQNVQNNSPPLSPLSINSSSNNTTTNTTPSASSPLLSPLSLSSNSSVQSPIFIGTSNIENEIVIRALNLDQTSSGNSNNSSDSETNTPGKTRISRMGGHRGKT